MKKTLITLTIAILAISFVFTGCFQNKETVTQEEIVFESKNNDVTVSLIGYEYAPKSDTCFSLRFKAHNNSDRKLVCTAYNLKIDGVVVDENVLNILADFKDTDEVKSNIEFGPMDEYTIDFENAKQIEFEYNIHDANDAAYTYNGTASFELKRKQ